MEFCTGGKTTITEWSATQPGVYTARAGSRTMVLFLLSQHRYYELEDIAFFRNIWHPRGKKKTQLYFTTK